MKETRWSHLFAGLVFLTDLALINLAFVATSLFKFGSLYPHDVFVPIYVQFQLFANLVFPLCLVMSGAYRDVAHSPLGHQAVTSFKACLWAGAVTVGVLFLVRNTGYSRAYVSFLLAQLTVLIPFSRILLERLNAAVRLRGHGVNPVLVVGEREPLRDFDLRLRLAPYLGYRVEAVMPVGFEAGEDGPVPRVVRNRADLEVVLRQGRIRRIFICDRDTDRRRWKTVIDLAEQYGARVRLVRWPLLVPDQRARIYEPLSIPLVPATLDVRCRGLKAVTKRAADVVLAGGLTLLLAPLLAAIAAAIRLDSPGPVIYRQERVGRGGRHFRIYKFRSMRELADEERRLLEEENEATGPLFKMRRDPRVTRVGGWLRRFSLDELPQLFNVLRGELSLVGPRPPIPAEVTHYEPWQAHRLDVAQGLTGLWQVSGRSRLTFEEMAFLDLYYIENWSFLLDVEILMETLPTVVHGDGAY